ncbi:MAG: serine/threonine-protein kinase [Planctomycetota bacterium]
MSFAQPFSNYEILDRIGSGAMGTVFKARQKHMNRIVALKVLKPSLARDTRYVERLRREAQIVGQLNHPNIVTGYDLGAEGGYHFFVMEFVEGRSLKELLEEWGGFTEDRVLDVAIQVTRALEHALEVGIIHRDIKPANILIDERNRVKLTDMGLAKVATDLTLTREGATVGTPQYISPEQAKNPRDVDVRSDLYSLGATLFHMSTGQTPFRAESIGELIAKVLHERAPSAIRLNPALTDGLSLVIRKLLAKDPDLRYQTPSDLLRDLERVQRSETPRVDTKELERDAARARRRSLPGPRSPAVLSLAVGVLLGAGGFWALDQMRGVDAGTDSVRPDYPNGLSLAGRLDLAQAELLKAREADPDSHATATWNAERLRLVSSIERVARERLRSLAGEESAQVLELVRRFDQPTAKAVSERLFARVFDDPIGSRSAPIQDEDLLRRINEPKLRLQERVREMFEAERGAFGQRLDRALVKVGRAVEELVADGRFDVAENLVARAIDDFLAQEFTYPDFDRSRLSTILRSDIAEREGVFTERQVTRITEGRARAVERLGAAGEDVASGFDQVLAQVVSRQRSPADARARIDALQRGLTRFHPPPSAMDPLGRELWSDLNQAYRSALSSLESEAELIQVEQRTTLLDLAYDFLPTLGPSFVAEWLDTVSDESGGSLALELRVFRAAGEVVSAVRDIAQPFEPVGREPSDRERNQLVVERNGEAPIVVSPLGWERPYTSVPFAVLQERLPEFVFSSRAERALGTAFWLLVEGRQDEARAQLARVDAESAADVYSRVLPRLLALETGTSSDATRARRLAELAAAMSEGELERVRTRLAELGEPQNDRERRILDQAVRWVRSEGAIAQRLLELGSSLQADVRRVDGLGLLAEMDPRFLESAGFERADATIRRVDSLEEDFETSRGHSLVVPGPGIAEGESFVVAFRFSLAELPGQSSLLVELGSTAFVLGCFGRDWEVVAAEIRPQDVDDPDAIRERLQIALLAALEGEGPRIVQNAWHRVEVAVRSGEAVFTVDGVEVAQQRHDPSLAMTLRVSAFGDFAFDRFRWLLPFAE